ncbi:MAG: polysaccharide pyruvyl transferase family protein [Planctomycetales bacterium]|nr:polysaccharide pyruvyl transferase family protein [Planctomycetales bacterium]
MLNRRNLFQSTFALALATQLRAVRGADNRPPRILLRSSWQVVNIGDIAHTPGVLALLEKYIPEAEVILWASRDITPEVIAMEHQRFPKLKIVQGRIEEDGTASNAELGEAIAWCDFLLHGSAPLFVSRDVSAFVQHSGKPYGVYGVTLTTYPLKKFEHVELLSQAKFVFFRDSVSMEYAREQGVDCPIMEFGPDGAFACDLRDDARADKFLRDNGLEDRKFLCCLSRFRYTPYWRIPGRSPTVIAERHARNEEMKERDHAPILAAILAVVRQTEHKVLLCPEDMTQMQVGKEMLYDKLPADVKPRVVWRENFWLTDEALSVYVRSAGLFGIEMHSPIMAVGNGIPAIVCRFAEQTSKGFMWRDIGLDDWLFDLDIAQEAARVPAAVLELAKDFEAAQAKAEVARQFVVKRQRETMAVLDEQLGALHRA